MIEGSMDPAIWSNLPEDVLTKVMARLPYTDIFRLRCVCKRWCVLVCSNSFQSQIVAAHRSHRPFFLRALKGFSAVVGYNPTRKEWHTLPLTFMKRGLKIKLLVASGGGLLCFYGKDGSNKSALVVCNPLTKEHRLLPPMAWNPFDDEVNRITMGKVLIVDEGTKGYKLFLADLRDVNGERCIVAQLYDSAADAWSTYAVPGRHQMLGQGVHVKGCVYFVGSKWVGDQNSCRMHKLCMSFDLESRQFVSCDDVPLAGLTRLVEIHDQLAIVVPHASSSSDGWNSTPDIIKRDCFGTWSDVTKFPADRLVRVQAQDCMGQGDFLYFTRENGMPVVFYNCVDRQWRVISHTDQKCEKRAFTTYHPSLLSV